MATVVSITRHERRLSLMSFCGYSYQFQSLTNLSVSKELPPLDEMTSDVDVDQLESTANLLGPKYIKKSIIKSVPSPKVSSKK